ncbi:MAG: chemotaxis protein methyltransferase CheR [Tenuifilum sp.]|jgi:chemotaxis protein methyltransferase CheR|uniref:CheR family methyltransferase n=1 Tax=Tenuifilum sp. TaxID=2760880 RepID=UPI0024AC19BC|nr:protein-glutamate O-methyltransferase [Tenuifilum sp.]MDI3528073.1 chemotaxis protein methyltransferase CheR [Tenuifilum sp.]
MPNSGLIDYHKLQLTNEEFQRLSALIYKESGIKLPPIKKVMLQSRLQKRLKHLKINTFKEYISYLFSKDGFDREIIHMLDVVSTNKTDFYREPAHFEFLANEVLPNYYSSNVNQTFKVWSAGCSSGEEPYTLAMVLFEFAEKNPKFNFSIFATDISTRILQKAVDAVYSEDKVQAIPFPLKKKYMLRSKDRTNPTVKMAPHVRSKITFDRLNLMDSTYKTKDIFDVIFCRNVLIYFDRETQAAVINKLSQRLKPEGYLILGHSESILNLNVPLVQVRPTVYRKV